MSLISKNARLQTIKSAPLILFSAIIALVASLNIVAICWFFHLATAERTLLVATLVGIIVFITLFLIYGDKSNTTRIDVAKTVFCAPNAITRAGSRKT